jgi:hypothetical protein
MKNMKHEFQNEHSEIAAITLSMSLAIQLSGQEQRRLYGRVRKADQRESLTYPHRMLSLNCLVREVKNYEIRHWQVGVCFVKENLFLNPLGSSPRARIIL